VSKPSVTPSGELLVGGQALIEGVMMRSPGAYGIAVRRPDGSIAIRRAKVASLARRWPALKLPVLRGVAVLFQSLAIGIRALNYSAETAVAETAEAETEPKAGTPKEGKREKKDASGWAVAGSMAFGLAFGIGIFLLLPLWLTQLGERFLFGEMGNLAFNLLDGALRALFFLVYIFVISRLPDIHRVFMYHGAEHKVVFNYEAGEPLTVANARAKSRLHPRCGTSFLLFVLLVSIFLFALIPKTAPFLVKFGGRLVLVPFVAGLAYEVLRLTAKKRAAPLFAAMVWPGLMLQKITTQEPADDMLEVAIVALEEALREDGLLPEAVPVAEAANSEPMGPPVPAAAAAALANLPSDL
jgi:uncharacterized protein YqhQ